MKEFKMREDCIAITGLRGSVFRITCDYKCFDSCVPYDDHCDESKKGTGFLVYWKGLQYPILLTNHHVISNAVNVTAISPCLVDGESRKLQIIGYNPHIDVAILVGPPELMSLPAFRVKSASTLKPGHEVSVVGFAGGTLRTHTTAGSVSGRNDWPHNRIQTDTAINPGNSGGPVLDTTSGRVLGLVTSGMDFMQATNFFVGIDEVALVCMRILRTWNRTKQVAIDLGYNLNAVLAPVNSAACHGAEGGALVVDCFNDNGLKKNDVIRKVKSAFGKWVHLDAFMRVREPSVWKYDAIDFRSLLDRIQSSNKTAKLPMIVRRAGKEVETLVTVGPNIMKSRELIPDCEHVKYVTFGGLILQMVSETHLNDWVDSFKERLEDPKVKLFSAVVVTHVGAGSPYAVHGANKIKGRIVKYLYDENNNCHTVKTLEDIVRFLRSYEPIVVEFKIGERVGTTLKSLQEYESNEKDLYLKRGEHTVGRGILNREKQFKNFPY
jgi:S1-C subfamily serine protease